MKAHRTPRSKARGFALFIVTIVVALVAIMAVSLLDQVGVDLIMAGEFRKTATARANGIGAMTEVVSDTTLLPHLPAMTDTTLGYRYIDKVSGDFVRDPDGLSTPVSANQSAYFDGMGTNSEESYRSSVRLIRLGNMRDSSFERTAALVYEVWLEASVNDGDATSQVRTEIWRPLTRRPGHYVPPAMAR